MWKKWLVGMILGAVMLGSGINLAFAQATIIPDVTKVQNCEERIAMFNSSAVQNKGSENPNTAAEGTIAEVLGCAIQTGRVSLAMIPYFLQYFSNYLLGMVGLIALLFVVIGGFMYTTGGVSEQKDTGKTFIKNALIGMAVAFLAWTIVNVVLAVVTR